MRCGAHLHPSLVLREGPWVMGLGALWRCRVKSEEIQMQSKGSSEGRIFNFRFAPSLHLLAESRPTAVAESVLFRFYWPTGPETAVPSRGR